MPMPDSGGHGTPEEEPAHDVLAAEAFAMPGPDPGLRHGPVTLPEDPSGIAEPHDVLAAEEFAMPAGRATASGGAALAGVPRRAGRIAAVAAALIALAGLRRRGR